MFALNFYSDLYGDLLRNCRKTVTIRLGDKSDKYSTGQVVWVTLGQRFGRRRKLYTAILDRVEVKPIQDLTPRDIERENSEFRNYEEVASLMERLYDRPILPTDTVTVIYFSRIDED
ncbi:MAG: RNA-binding protein [Armatimonadetes bacterium]|nr:RNA-binding protein [Armatimonadota bacterium]